MSGVKIVMTIYFENHFWVGVVERTYNEVCKIAFRSSDLKDYQVYEFILGNWYDLELSHKTRAVKR